MRIICALILSFLALGLVSTDSSQPPADLILKNGVVYTVNDKQPRAEAIAIRADRIVFVGSDADVKKYEGKNTRVVDLQGKTVVPGMTDAHYHLLGVGQREVTLNLEGTTSLEDFLARVRERVGQAKPGAWVTGRGWIETFWKPQAFPTRQDLDRIAPVNPLYLVRADGHGAVANSAALKIAGVTRETPNPFGGEILKDRATGEPTGMLIDAAKELVTRHIPAPTEADNENATVLGVERSIRLGWTQIQDAGGSYNDVARLKKLYTEGRIKLRIYKAVYGPGPDAERLLKEGMTVGAFNNRFTLRTIKIPFDGALGSRGAALLAPYSDAPNTSGFLTQKEDEVATMLESALRRGIQVETHAIGDRANRVILDLYEKAMNTVPPAERKIREPRWRVEHAQIVDPVDLPRFARLGIIPSMQPSHAIGDLFFAPSRLGLKRLEGAYAWQSFLKSGAIIAGGSDAPVERGEPMIEFYAAVARRSLKGESGEGWHPEQAVTREQALKMFTLWPAFAAFEEKMKGSIEVGKLADLTILSADIMKIPAPEILQTRCVMTVINGEIVYDASVSK
ncbi:MAG: amidohydrolase [Pyrinomonadaceae bacterium]|nr:amidohydrolase [Pyrinomonadaceae bacterium]